MKLQKMEKFSNYGKTSVKIKVINVKKKSNSLIEANPYSDQFVHFCCFYYIPITFPFFLKWLNY